MNMHKLRPICLTISNILVLPGIGFSQYDCDTDESQNLDVLESWYQSGETPDEEPVHP